jgi:acyl dehydratase
MSFDHLAGTALPGGDARISAAEDRRLVEAIGGVPDPSGALHPLWAFVAMRGGVGVTIPELFALVEFDVADGPMIGSTELEWRRPLQAGEAYRVGGEIVGVERRHGRRTGAFDLMRVRERLLDGDGAEVATAAHAFVLPRRGAA